MKFDRAGNSILWGLATADLAEFAVGLETRSVEKELHYFLLASGRESRLS